MRDFGKLQPRTECYRERAMLRTATKRITKIITPRGVGNFARAT